MVILGRVVADLHEIWWQAVKSKLLIDRAAFMVAAKAWVATPVYSGDELAAVLIHKGREIHLIKTGNHQFTRRLIRETLGPMLAVCALTTRVPATDTASRNFVRRIGFRFVGPEKSDYLYILEGLRHA